MQSPVATASGATHFAPSVAPLAQTNETSSSSSPQPTDPVPVTTRKLAAGPGSPLGPGGPAAPGGPAGPCGPLGADLSLGGQAGRSPPCRRLRLAVRAGSPRWPAGPDARTGLGQPEAERRVDDVIAHAKENISRGRKSAVILAFSAGASALLGLVIAWFAACEGGRHRDGTPPRCARNGQPGLAGARGVISAVSRAEDARRS
jgi:hypothetical protein